MEQFNKMCFWKSYFLGTYIIYAGYIYCEKFLQIMVYEYIVDPFEVNF